MCDCLNTDSRRFFLNGMRLFFGLWFLYAGVSKWIPYNPETGFSFAPGGTVAYLVGMFEKTWSPAWATTILTWIIMIGEPLLALWVLSGWKPRLAWGATALLMFQLLLGQTLLQSPTTVDLWFFVVLTLACAALSDPPSGTQAAA